MQDSTRYFEDFEVGQAFELGPAHFSADAIVAFASRFDPQPMHLDEEAGKASMLGGLGASGWHIGAEVLRMIQRAVVAGSASRGGPGIDEMVWKRAVLAGDTVSGGAEVRACRPLEEDASMGSLELAFSLSNQSGEVVVHGQLPIWVTKRGEGVA